MENKDTPQKEEKIVDFVNRPKEGVIPRGLEEITTPITSIYEDYVYLKPTSTAPTNPPTRPLEKYVLYVNGADKRLYVFNSDDATWDYVSFGAASSGSIAGRMTNSAGQNIPTSTDTQLTFNTADVEEGITCDLTNDRFEILTAGVYLVTAQVSYADPVSGKIIQAIIEDDTGSYLSQSQWITSSTDMLSVSVSYMASFSVGDKIQLHTFHNCGGDETIQSGQNTYFQINKV